MIKLATNEDINSIVDLASILFKEPNKQELKDEFIEMLSCDDNAVFLYEIEAENIAFAQCQLRYDYVEGTDSTPVAYLEGIFVKEEYRQKNIAKKLLAECEKWAKSKKCSEFASDCELDNKVSEKFHEKMGFTEANRIICFTKEIDK